MEEKFYIQKELAEIAPTLSNLKKSERNGPSEEYFNALQVNVIHKITLQATEERELQGYFDELPNKVMAQLKPVNSSRRNTWTIGLAASLILALGVLFLFNQKSSTISDNSSYTTFINDLQDDEMIYLLSELTTASDIAVITDYKDDDITIPQNIDDADLLQYLNEVDLMQDIELQ